MCKTIADRNGRFRGLFKQPKKDWEPAGDNPPMEDLQPIGARPDSDPYRDTARRLRELASEFRFPGARQELLELALRYERRADNLDTREP